MADVLRIIRNAMARKIGYMLVAAIVGFFVTQCAHAEDYYWTTDGANWTKSGSAAGSCAIYTNAYNVEFRGVDPHPNGESYAWCRYHPYNQAPGYELTTQMFRGGDGCTAPKVLQNGSCTDAPDPVCTPGNVVESFDLANGAALDIQTVCANKCNAPRKDTPLPPVCYPAQDGIPAGCLNPTRADFITDGGKCTPSNTGTVNPSPLPTLPSPCPACDCLKQGKSYGTVNGATVCVGAGSPGSAPIKQPDTTSTSSGGSTNGGAPTGGSTTTTSTTVNNNNTTTTTTTTISGGTGPGGTGAGSTTTTDTKTEPITDYCTKNPKAQMCKEADKGEFGGSCEGGWTCDGDAATCALAKRVHISRCEDMKKNDSTLLGEAAMAGTHQDNDDPRLESNTKVITVSELNTSSGSLPDGGCLSDKSFSVGGRSIVIPLSELCPYLGMMGNGILALAWLAAAMIVTGNRGGKA